MKGKKKDAETLYYDTVSLISKKWVILILHVLAMNERVRFSEFADHIPDINTRVLSQRLTELEKSGLLFRTVENGKPVAVYYELTKKAQGLMKVFSPLAEWANTWATGKKIPKH